MLLFLTLSKSYSRSVSDYDSLDVGREIFKSSCLLNLAALSFDFEEIFHRFVSVYKFLIAGQPSPIRVLPYCNYSVASIALSSFVLQMPSRAFSC